MRATMPEPHKLAIRVYWEDTDAGGVVYHASYLRFMERGRTELLRDLGVDQSALQQESGIVFVVADMNIKFRAPGKLDDVLLVETTVTETGGASLLLSQKISRAGELLVEADVTCAVISGEGKPVRLPAEVKGKLN
jgi:acyl-CoA thioester hydrolase